MPCCRKYLRPGIFICAQEVVSESKKTLHKTTFSYTLVVSTHAQVYNITLALRYTVGPTCTYE